VETKAPDGYLRKEGAVRITIEPGSEVAEVTYDEGTSLSGGGSGLSYDTQSRVYTLLVSNKGGCELPYTGGRGRGAFYLSGALVLPFAAWALAAQKQR
jgi:hypothetical protein